MNNNDNQKFKIDWIIHGIIDDEKDSISYHTHGLDKHGMLELELKIDFEPKQANEFINLIAMHLIQNKIIIKEEAIVEKIFNTPIYFKKMKAINTMNELGFKTDVLRVVFQDPNFLFPWEEGCHPAYKSQLDKL